jgi:hypothetical protein
MSKSVRFAGSWITKNNDIVSIQEIAKGGWLLLFQILWIRLNLCYKTIQHRSPLKALTLPCISGTNSMGDLKLDYGIYHYKLQGLHPSVNAGRLNALLIKDGLDFT